MTMQSIRVRQFFPLSWNVSRFFCHLMFFFSSSKVSINKNANRGQLQKRKENRVRDSRNFRKSHETCVIVGIKIGSSRQRKSRCIRTYNSRQRYKKKKMSEANSFLFWHVPNCLFDLFSQSFSLSLSFLFLFCCNSLCFGTFGTVRLSPATHGLVQRMGFFYPMANGSTSLVIK